MSFKTIGELGLSEEVCEKAKSEQVYDNIVASYILKNEEDGYKIIFQF
ncbi:MAG: hypothetical protein PQJ46_07725 [Spirochaetales bacterium]|nr:hypothetical protein [Spirochaetales bacterium]